MSYCVNEMAEESVPSKLEGHLSEFDPSEEWREVIEERYNLCMLFYCLCKEDIEEEEPKYGAFDRDWLMAQFADLLGAPQYMCLKTCSYKGDEDWAKDLKLPPYYSIYYEDKEYSYTQSTSIKVMDRNDGSDITTLEGHSFYVRCLALFDGKLYSGSTDGSIKVWNCRNDTLLTTLKFGAPITSLTTYDGLLYAGGHNPLGGDMAIKVWNCCDESFIRVFTPANIQVVSSLNVHDGKLYAGDGSTGVIKIWNIDGGLIKTLSKHTWPPSGCAFQDGKMYSIAKGGEIKVWKL